MPMAEPNSNMFTGRTGRYPPTERALAQFYDFGGQTRFIELRSGSFPLARRRIVVRVSKFIHILILIYSNFEKV